jgi:hypothetical protein
MTVSVNGTTGITFNDASTQNTAATGFGFKNRIINGAMMIDQRNAGASVTPTNNQYTLDRWVTAAAQTNKFSVQQNAGSVTPPAGFKNYLGVTSLSSYSVVSGDVFAVAQGIEGFNVADLGWGTANAQTVTLSFWVRSSLTGTFGGTVKNAMAGATRSYPFSYTISAANTWEQKSVTIAGDTSGSWSTSNVCGMEIGFSIGTASDSSGTAGSWSSNNYWSATGAVSVVGTNGATFYITGVQLEKGSTATSFDYRPYGTELSLCQRYCNVIRPLVVSSGLFSGLMFGASTSLVTYNYPVVMRSSPTFTFSSAGDFGVVTGGNVDVATAISTSGIAPTNTRFDFTIGTGRTSGQGSIIQTQNTSTTITASAEL